MRAQSPIFARLVAETWAASRAAPSQLGNEQTTPRFGFLDEKLYWVKRAPAELYDMKADVNVAELGEIQSDGT